MIGWMQEVINGAMCNLEGGCDAPFFKRLSMKERSEEGGIFAAMEEPRRYELPGLISYSIQTWAWDRNTLVMLIDDLCWELDGGSPLGTFDTTDHLLSTTFDTTDHDIFLDPL